MDTQSRLVLLFLLALVLGTVWYLFIHPRQKRRRIDRQPFPADWLAILRRRVPFYDRMSPDHRRQLRQLIKRFLQEKRFIGCAGQIITDEIRITIAAQACLLLLDRPSSEYARLRFILVYPDDFIAEHPWQDEAGVVSHERHVLSGESWDDGRVVLAWDSVEEGVIEPEDGYNVVLHEFAHQLDQEAGAANGLPLLSSKEAYADWARTFSRAFAELQHEAETRQHSVMDHYGATDPAEFFAVATETFYEKPGLMAEHHPGLFEQLRGYYRVDPRQWQDHS